MRTEHGSDDCVDGFLDQMKKGKQMKRFEKCSGSQMGLVTLLLLALLAGCGSRDEILGHSASGIPGAPPGAILPGAVCTASAGPTVPNVTSSNPINGDLNVTTSTTGVAGGGKSITANFSLRMDAATLVAANITLSPVGGTALIPASVTSNATATVVTLTTSSALQPGTSYTAVIARAVTSAAGTPLGCIYAFNFSTGPVAAAGAAAINLGLVTPFAIAASAGMTNSGATKINGDVVLDPNDTCNAVAVGSGNDFGLCSPPNPPTHNAGDRVITNIFPDTTTADAVMQDLNDTFLSIAPAAMPGAIVLGCGTIGTGGGAGVGIGCAGNATLPPGVYISATSSTIGVTGDLTLSGGGNGNAVWVFQAPSAITTAVGSRILLTNGAKASNVWWYVGSSATLNGASFQGNVLAAVTISMGTLATSCGRLLAGATGAGQFTFLSNIVSVPGHPNAPPICQ